MLFGKYINRYYLKYAGWFLIGIISLIVVDWIQLYIPEFLGKVVDLVEDDIVANKQEIINIGLKVLIGAAGLFVGRFLWRITLFRASFKIEASLRHEMFLKAEALPRQFYHETKIKK